MEYHLVGPLSRSRGSSNRGYDFLGDFLLRFGVAQTDAAHCAGHGRLGAWRDRFGLGDGDLWIHHDLGQFFVCGAQAAAAVAAISDGVRCARAAVQTVAVTAADTLQQLASNQATMQAAAV